VADDALQDAAEDALMDYARRPQRVDFSSAESLERFLYRAAWRNAADSLEAEARRRRREALCLLEAARRTSLKTPESSMAHHADLASRILGIAIDDAERNALRCWLSGEHRTGPLALALGVGALTVAEQRRTVKRFKDRMRKRLTRLKSKSCAR
jgi:hypothetical protein